MTFTRTSAAQERSKWARLAPSDGTREKGLRAGGIGREVDEGRYQRRRPEADFCGDVVAGIPVVGRG